MSPESVREVVERRLSLLGELSNELLSIAAVIGRDFSLRVLQQVSGRDTDDVLDALEDCIEARLIDERAGIGQYRFSHALVRETLYAQLRTSRRVRLHGQVGESLERAYAADLATHANELAHHFAAATTAGYTTQAMTYATLAAEHALGAVRLGGGDPAVSARVAVAGAAGAARPQPTDRATAAARRGANRMQPGDNGPA